MIKKALENQRIILTGGSRGIGRAIAQLFATEGARVFFSYRNNLAAAQQTLASLTGDGHAFAPLDQADAAAIPKFMQQAESHLGGYDLLINNAAVYLSHDPFDSNFEDWVRQFEQTIQVNLSGPAHLSHQAIQYFKSHGGGRIINIGSRGAYRGEPQHPGYAAAKAGLHALTQSLARAGGAAGIYCFGLAPGFVATDMAQPILAGPGGEGIRQQSPLGRVAEPNEVAQAALHFAAGNGDFSTGCILDINGASYLR